MTVKKELLDILCCPETKVPVVLLPKEKMEKLNTAIEKGSLNYVDGSKVESPVEEGLITEDNKTVYVVDDDIPVMLIEKGIKTDQIKGFN